MKFEWQSPVQSEPPQSCFHVASSPNPVPARAPVAGRVLCAIFFTSQKHCWCLEERRTFQTESGGVDGKTQNFALSLTHSRQLRGAPDVSL